MKKHILLLILFISSTLNGFSQWALDSLSSARSGFDAVTFENKIYFIGGETDWLNVTSEVAIYNCLTSGWELSDSLALGRSYAASVSGDSAIYVFGGRTYTTSHSWIREYTGTDSIDIFKNGVWHSDTTIINGKVWGGHGLKVGSKIMFAGFVDSIEYITSEYFASNKVYIYDELTGIWSMDTLSTARTEIAVATDGTIAMFAGGVNGLGYASDVVDIYNSVTGSWSTASLSVPRCFLAGAYANGKFYFAGGVLEGLINYPSDVIDVYDGTTWTTSSLPSPRAAAEAAVVNDNIYFMGGGIYNLSYLAYPNLEANDSTVDVLNTVTGTWSRVDFKYQHLNFAKTTWGNKIFVGGGGYSRFYGSPINEYMPYVEILDVSTIGITDLSGNFSFEVYPNPSNGPVIILLPENDAEITVTDIIGHEIVKAKTTGKMINLDLADNGLFVVYVKTKHGSAIRKVIVNR